MAIPRARYSAETTSPKSLTTSGSKDAPRPRGVGQREACPPEPALNSSVALVSFLGSELLLAATGGLSEYFYLDLLAKTGIVGFLLYLLPVLYTLFIWLKKGTTPTKVIWMGVLWGFLAVSFFNPYMNSSLGILFYCCSIPVFHLQDAQAQTNIEL